MLGYDSGAPDDHFLLNAFNYAVLAYLEYQTSVGKILGCAKIIFPVRLFNRILSILEFTS